MRKASAASIFLRKANHFASEASKSSAGAVKTWRRVNKIASESSKTSPPQELAKFGAQRQFFASKDKTSTNLCILVAKLNIPCHFHLKRVVNCTLIFNLIYSNILYMALVQKVFHRLGTTKI